MRVDDLNIIFPNNKIIMQPNICFGCMGSLKSKKECGRTSLQKILLCESCYNELINKESENEKNT